MENQLATKQPSLKELLSQTDVKKRFEEMLGKKSAGFISSIISATKANKDLANCEPNSVLSAAVIAATLDLPIQNNLGFAAIVPYKEKGVPVAQFQMMWRGFVQLAMRTGQYQTMNVCEVYEGELIKSNRFTGEYEFDEAKKVSDKIIGYTAYFRMTNGFAKSVYWTVEQVKAHGKRYSKSFGSEYGRWHLDFDAMAKKTVLKLLLSKFGILSVDMQMQQAVMADQAAITGDTKDAEFEYVDRVPDETERPSKEAIKEEKLSDRITKLIEAAKNIADLEKLSKDVPPELKNLYHAQYQHLQKGGKLL